MTVQNLTEKYIKPSKVKNHNGKVYYIKYHKI